MSLLFSKLSLFMLFLRVFLPNRKLKHMIYLGITVITLIFISVIVVATTLCAPRHGEYWDSPAVASRCGKEGVYAVIQGPFNILIDFYILYLPIPILYKLQLQKKKKIGIMAIFMTGSMYGFLMTLHDCAV